MKYSIKDWGKGLNADALPSELQEGSCSAASNVRFRDGFAERVLGFLRLKTYANTPDTIGSLDIYSPPDASEFYAIVDQSNLASADKLYVIDVGASGAGVETEVTPAPIAGATIASITWSGTQATLTTTTPHGLTTGTYVAVSGVTPSGYNTAAASITVTAPDVFKYTVLSNPGGAASVVGSYTKIYYSGGTTTGGNFVGNYILNASGYGLMYWNGDTGTDFALVSGSYVALVSRPFKNYIVQLGPTISGTVYRKMVAWSSAAEPGSLPSSFTASDTNDAGNVELAESSGTVIDCLALGDTNIVYMTDGRYAMRYIGGNEVFSFTKLPGNEGLYGVSCAVNTPLGHVFITQDLDVRIHSGGESRSIAQGRVRSLMTDLPSIAVHYDKNEVWICCPGGSRTLIWNWAENNWGEKDSSVKKLVGGNGRVYTDSANILLASSTTKLFHADADDQDDGVDFNSVVERSGLDLGDADYLKYIQRSRWNFDGVDGATYTIKHGSTMTANDLLATYIGSATYTLGTTDYANLRGRAGRFLAVQVTWTSSSTTRPGRVRSCDLDVALGGKR